MSAKENLLSRLKYLEIALSSSDVIDISLDENDHNGAANLLRKGLGIVAFNILEDFIKEKSQEALNSLSISGAKYSDLTIKLQEATTLGALKALAFRAKIEKKDGGSWLSLIQDESKNISSTSSDSFTLSKFSFVHESSNISYADIKDLLSAFNISGGWQTLKKVSDDIGGGVNDLAQSYKNAFERRHSAAHTSGFKYEFSWLSNIKSEIIAISASIDILLTVLCRLVDASPLKKMDEHQVIPNINYRFLVSESGVFKEKKTLTSRSIKNWANIEDAILALEPLSRSRKEILIVHSSSGRIEGWFT
jgi:hypothetical protein